MVLGGYHIGAWLKVRSCLTSLLKMGICWPKLAPSKHKDELVSSKSSTVVPTSSSTTDYESSTHETISCEANRAEAKRNIPGVELIGDLLCPFTLRVLIALQFKVKCFRLCGSLFCRLA